MVKSKIKDPQLILKRQRQICQGALKVFRSKGYHATSIREISKACHISLGSLYDYIEKKEDILFLVHKEILDQIYDCLNENINKFNDPVEQLTNTLKALFYLSCRLKEEILFVYTESKSLEKKYLYEVLGKEAEFVNELETLIKKGVKTGQFICPNPEVFSNIVAFIWSIIPLRGWNLVPKNSEEEIIEILTSLVLKGLDVK